MRLVSDNASTLLLSDITDAQTTLPLTDASNFPEIPVGSTDYAVLTIEDELGRMERVKLTERTTGNNTPTVERGFDGTTALAFAADARVELRSTASLFELFYQRNEGDTADANSEITLLLRRYLVTGEEPGLNDLVEGEMAVNIPDRKIWIGAIGATEQNPLAPVLLTSGASGGAALEVTQGAHGFVVGQPIYFDGTVWRLARANDEATVGTHIVGEVRTGNVFIATLSGQVGDIDASFQPLTPGALYYVSPSIAGAYVTDAPTNPGDYTNPLAVALTSTSFIVLPWRALAAASGSGGGVDLLVSQVAHGYDSTHIGQPMYFDGTDWLPADASDGGKLAIGVLKSVSDINTFTVTQGGEVENVAPEVNGGSPLVAGTFYYTAGLPGQIATSPPQGGFQNQILLALSATSALVMPRNYEDTERLWDRYEWLTPNDGQVLFTGLTYTPGYLEVEVNGSGLASTDFTANDGSTFTLVEPVTAQDVVRAVAMTKGDTVPLEAHLQSLTARNNLLINGDFRVNQRGGTRTPGVGVYGFDRWKGHTSGLEQIVEQASLRDGVYTLSWVGGGTGSLDGGAAAASPITAALTITGDVSVVVPSDATDVQLEIGDRATPFEVRSIGEELALCQRYFESSLNIPGDPINSVPIMSGTYSQSGTQTYGSPFYFKVPKRATPTVSVWAPGGTSGQVQTTFGNSSSVISAAVLYNLCQFYFAAYTSSANSMTLGQGAMTLLHFEADAEL